MKKFAYGFDCMLPEMVLCQVSNETGVSEWLQTPTLDFFHQSSCSPSP